MLNEDGKDEVIRGMLADGKAVKEIMQATHSNHRRVVRVRDEMNTPDVAIPKRSAVASACAKPSVASSLEGLSTEKTSAIIEREVLEPTDKIISVCTQIPDGELCDSQNMRQFIGISKSAWSDVEKDPRLTSFRCYIPKAKSPQSFNCFFGNDREVAKMKRKNGVK